MGSHLRLSPCHPNCEIELKQFFVKLKIIKILLWIQCHNGCWHDDYIAFKVYVKLNNFWRQFADNQVVQIY